jgi:putative copper export protein
MSEEVRSIILWLHLIFIAVWIGSQVLTGFAVIPTLRRIESRADRMDLLRAFTRRFGLIAWGALLIVLITGGVLTEERVDIIRDGFDSIFDLRWGWIFVIKMALFLVMAGLVALHSVVLGPRLMELNQRAIDQVEGGDRRIRRLQVQSGVVAGLGMLTSLLVLGCGAFLGNNSFSFVAT